MAAPQAEEKGPKLFATGTGFVVRRPATFRKT
jgi:hypothetical protein